MDFNKIISCLENEPSYRFSQLKRLIFRDLISDWNEAAGLPLILRERLKKEAPLEIKGEIVPSKEKDSAKAVIELEDGLKIESVLMKHRFNRNTVCVSSQVGCPLGCSFCLTGKMGFKRNLSQGEIVSQVLFFGRYLKPKKVNSIVFMGMGEPFLNYDSVISAIRTLNEKETMNLGSRHFSISTVGIVDGINRLADEKMEINLAISLHASNDELRSRLMPINEKYPLRDILKAVDSYLSKTKRRVMFEYIMIKGVNDSPENAEELAGIMKKPLYLVNLINYNPTGVFEPSSKERIKAFFEILKKRGVPVTVRHRFGDDISASCGQLGYKK